MNKTYSIISEGTAWLDELLLKHPEVLENNDVVIVKTMGGDYKYLVSTEIYSRDERAIMEIA